MSFMYVLSLAFSALVYGFQNDYIVKQERVETEYYSPKICEHYSNVYKFNRTTNSLNVTFFMKTDLTEHDLCIVTGYKWLSNRYRLDIIQFQHTIKSIMNFKYFDVKRLLHEHSVPPINWPLHKDIYYRMTDWIPDSRQFPPGIPEGKWKLNLNFIHDNASFVIMNWYICLTYKVKYPYPKNMGFEIAQN